MTRVVTARREAPGDHRHGSGKLLNRDVIDFDKMANTTFINLLKFVRQQRESGALNIECDDDIYTDDDIQEIVTWCKSWKFLDLTMPTIFLKSITIADHDAVAKDSGEAEEPSAELQAALDAKDKVETLENKVDELSSKLDRMLDALAKQ